MEWQQSIEFEFYILGLFLLQMIEILLKVVQAIEDDVSVCIARKSKVNLTSSTDKWVQGFIQCYQGFFFLSLCFSCFSFSSSIGSIFPFSQVHSTAMDSLRFIWPFLSTSNCISTTFQYPLNNLRRHLFCLAFLLNAYLRVNDYDRKICHNNWSCMGHMFTMKNGRGRNCGMLEK